MTHNDGLARLASRLAAMVESDDDEIRLLVGRARKAIRRDGAGAECAELADQLTRRCMTVSEQDNPAPGTASGRAGAPPVETNGSKSPLRRLFGRRASDRRESDDIRPLQSLIERVAAQVESLHDQAARAATIRALSLELEDGLSIEAAVSRVALELDAVELASVQQNHRTNKVLDHFCEQLGTFEESLTGTKGAADESFSRSERFGEQVDADVSTMGLAAQRAGIDELRTVVEQRIRSIQDNLLKHLEEERRQHEETRVRLGEMSAHLSEIKHESQQLRDELREKSDLAMRDPLTGVLNRLAFETRAQALFDQCLGKGAPLTVVFVDCNRFKQINDTFGHAAGDLVLSTVGGVLQSRTRAADFVCRYGGDEFVLLLCDTPIDGASVLARDIYTRVSESDFNDNGQPVEVTVSLGLTQARSGETVEAVLKRADEAMYIAKKKAPPEIAVLPIPEGDHPATMLHQ